AQEEQRLAQLSHHLRQWEREFQEKLAAAETELAEEEKRLRRLAAELSAQRSQLEEERAQFLKQGKELGAREIELQVRRADADGEIQRLKDEAAKERQKYVE